MTTRPDIQQKRDTQYHLRRREVQRLHEKAADAEQRAASLGQTIAITQAAQISAMIEAALLRAQARGISVTEDITC